MRSVLLSLLALVAAGVSFAQTVPASNATSGVPTLTGVLDGARTAVFSTPQDSCIANDIPDAMARAFRDYTGTVHLISASSDLFQGIGPSLETVEHSCDIAFQSANDPDPADYNDQVWIDSFYTLDGKSIAALSHTEYHGWSHPGECKTQNIVQCEYDSDTYHFSDDGGYHFAGRKAPGNLIADIPYKYEIDRGPMGYSVDTNIIEYGGWYYAVATDWTWPANCSGTTGPQRCRIPTGGAPLRTKNVYDPASWRAWRDGDFSMPFVDPYVGPVANPSQHVYTPVPYMGFVNAINYYPAGDLVVATLWDYWDNELGTPGLYLTTSRDLVHWTTPTLVVTVAQLSAYDPPGSWLYAYFSLIDPTSPDRNFATIGDHPYVYYVRLDNNDVYHRVLYRQKVKLTLNP